MESPVKEEVGGELAMEIESSVTAEDWRRALSRVVPAVAVLRTTAPRAFDTEVAGASYATGFVVDKARGIILTNRHVVKPSCGLGGDVREPGGDPCVPPVQRPCT
ncbi:unnamed protein product [Triticum turgidum subsp. durum]|uniref:Protease Do-like 7 n=1 Tax=Triticum turgidum subsp. durum TaxID=4567 RepID=A0A9R0Y5M9_TRITD|nr:unnamed protein product [Triticum turgidum subsp. durum]